MNVIRVREPRAGPGLKEATSHKNKFIYFYTPSNYYINLCNIYKYTLVRKTLILLKKIIKIKYFLISSHYIKWVGYGSFVWVPSREGLRLRVRCAASHRIILQGNRKHGFWWRD